MKKTPSNFIVKELLSLDNIFLELENCLLSDCEGCYTIVVFNNVTQKSIRLFFWSSQKCKLEKVLKDI